MMVMVAFMFGGASTQAAAAMTDAQVAALTPAQVAALPLADVKTLSPAQIRTMTIAQVAEMTLPQIGMLTPVQNAALSPDQIKAMRSMQFITFDAEGFCRNGKGVLAVDAAKDERSCREACEKLPPGGNYKYAATIRKMGGKNYSVCKKNLK